jgi:hypothetical protein
MKSHIVKLTDEQFDALQTVYKSAGYKTLSDVTRDALHAFCDDHGVLFPVTVSNWGGKRSGGKNE